jgi:hypothetical protein
MRLTIIPVDGAVYKEGFSYSGLDLSFAPTDIHALQWYDTYGEIEFKRQFVNNTIVHPQNQIITELPEWVSQALVKWDEAEAARLAAEAEAARLAAEEAARLAAEEEAAAQQAQGV